MNKSVKVTVGRLCVLILWAGGSVTGMAEPISPDQLESAVASAQPGETLVVKDGVYRDVKLELKGKGAPEMPVVVKAESPGCVVFSGETSIELIGEHLILAGFSFKDGHAARKAVIAIEGSYCRLTETVIDSFNPPDAKREDKWVTLRGIHHRVDHCTFRNKTSPSVTLTVWRSSDVADHHTIMANHFHTRPKGAESNGYETIRIGTSDASGSNSHTAVTGNLFEYCDGEMEAVSVKAGNNTITGNTFNQCAGTLTLRHGNGSRVEGNLFVGKRKPGTGGVRVYGANHVVSGNIFIGTMGRGGGALALMAGNPDPKPNEFQRADNVMVENNLFAANSGPAIKLDEQYRVDDRTLLPRKITVRANILSSDDLPSLVSGADHSGIELTWDRNQLFKDNQIPSEFTKSLPHPLKKQQVGAEWYRDQLP